MSDDDQRPDGARRDHDDTEPSGLVDSDDTTQADAGMVGGTGAIPEEATAQPYGTEPEDDEEQANPSSQ